MINRNEILRFIWQHPGSHRKEIATTLQYRPNMVTDIVGELIDERWVGEGERKPGRQGRSPISLYVEPKSRAALAVSYLSGVRVAAVNASGAVTVEKKRSEVPQKPQALANLVGELAREVLRGYRGEVIGIGVADPGMIDAVRNEVIKSSTFPAWRNVPMAQLISDATGLPALLEDSTRLRAIAQYRALPELRSSGANMLYVDFDRNLGFSLVTPEGIFRGSGFAGELAHVVVDAGGPDCRCGARGCLEIMAGGLALAARAKARLDSGADSELKGLEPLTHEAVLEAAQAGDRMARSAVSSIFETLAPALALAVSAYHPHCVVVGAGSKNAASYMAQTMERALMERMQPEIAATVQVRPGDLPESLVLSGAGLMVFNEIIMRDGARLLKS